VPPQALHGRKLSETQSNFSSLLFETIGPSRKHNLRKPQSTRHESRSTTDIEKKDYLTWTLIPMSPMVMRHQAPLVAVILTDLKIRTQSL